MTLYPNCLHWYECFRSWSLSLQTLWSLICTIRQKNKVSDDSIPVYYFVKITPSFLHTIQILYPSLYPDSSYNHHDHWIATRALIIIIMLLISTNHDWGNNLKQWLLLWRGAGDPVESPWLHETLLCTYPLTLVSWRGWHYACESSDCMSSETPLHHQVEGQRIQSYQ